MNIKHIITWLFLIGILITIITHNTNKSKKEHEQTASKDVKKHKPVILTDD